MTKQVKKRGMTKQVKKKVWTKPEVKRLGELKDVSGINPGNVQGNFS